MSNYWYTKLSYWLHDPVHKALGIYGHVGRAEKIADALEISFPDEQDGLFKSADWIAAALTRAALPGHSKDAAQSGAVNFGEHPEITHPLVKSSRRFSLPKDIDMGAVHDSLLQRLKEDLGLGQSAEVLEAMDEAERPFNGFFNRSNDPEGWRKALFFYLFFALPKRLRTHNDGNLGAVWEWLPADTRMPDHSIWHHCALTSAIGSSQLADPDRKVSLVAYAITPVQDFIAKARKLRDFWVGSVLLSYMSFVAIREVMQELGPDHVVYPSLHDQVLVDAWIGDQFSLEHFLKDIASMDDLREKSREVASFPNKFVFLSPAAGVAKMVEKMDAAVQKAWLEIGDMVMDLLCKEDAHTARQLFQHQLSDYWTCAHATCHLLWLNQEEHLAQVMPKERWANERDTVSKFAQQYNPTGHDPKASARLYGTSHALLQSLLAADKLRPVRVRKAQQGEKCPLCGEHEVLHNAAHAQTGRARDYAAEVKAFWDELRQQNRFTHQIGDNERLCAVCSIKRFLPMALKDKTHLLGEVLGSKGAPPFPSTTEMATHGYVQALRKHVDIPPQQLKKFHERWHEAELNPHLEEEDELAEIIRQGKAAGVTLGERDKYYAVLLMDGDHMGKLINGESVQATWRDVLHPELRQKFDRQGFAESSPLKKVGLDKKRIMSPAVHASISEALNSFARFAVPPIVSSAGGRLIYAGGDDVCAVLPLDTALDVAQRIRKAYNMDFVTYRGDGAEENAQKKISQSADRMGLHLGKGEGISISAGLIIAHHKEPLREVMRDAHALLDQVAKQQGGRNAMAIRLQKRSGGARDMVMRWDAANPFAPDETLWDAFYALMSHVVDGDVSSRLLYRLEHLKDALWPLLRDAKFDDNTKVLHIGDADRDRVLALFQYEAAHSGLKPKDKDDPIETAFYAKLPARLAGLCVRKPASKEGWFTPEIPVIARFMASERGQQ